MSDAGRGHDPAEETARPDRVACWLCGWPIVVRSTQRDRIYLFCMECGMQVVVHSATGASRLRALVDHGRPDREDGDHEPRGALTG